MLLYETVYNRGEERRCKVFVICVGVGAGNGLEELAVISCQNSVGFVTLAVSCVKSDYVLTFCL